jgi:drug/metabolite transporter (DMT)-like permease
VVGGLLAALASAVCYGVASVLQAVAARNTAAAHRVDPKLLARVLRQRPFLIGLALDGLGFVAQFIALRTLPVFAVQAALAASLAVTAVVAVPVLGLRLERPEWLAVAAVCVGLALVGLSANAESARPASYGFHVALLVSVVVLGLAGYGAERLTGPMQPVALGLVAGLAFGVVALSARAIESAALDRLLRDPAAYALVAAGAVAFLYYTIGLQRAVVTTVTATLVIGETVLPAIVGALAFGDSTRSGLVVVGILGFIVAVAGSLSLARFGDVR